VLLSSCFSIPKTFKWAYDENSPAEQNAIVTFVGDTKNGYFIIDEWNSLNINEDLYGGKNISSADKAQFTVPAGTNTFMFETRYTFSSQYSSRTYRIEDVVVQYNFEAGEKYEVRGKYKSLGFLGFGGLEFYVCIYNVTKGSQLLEEKMIGTTAKQSDK